MNRILFNQNEIDGDNPFFVEGARACHILSVLKGREGQTLRVGILDGPLGTATVVQANENSLSLLPVWGETPRPIRIDLMLALPRPKVMRRLWAPLAAMGVGHIALVNAAKVERNYFDTHWLQPAHYTPRLVEGLQQAGDSILPTVSIHRRLKPFIEEELARDFHASARLVAHPRATQRFEDLPPAGKDTRLLLAIGPEGGWTDFELELLQAYGFNRVAAGARTLRTDTACIALLALAHNHLDNENS